MTRDEPDSDPRNGPEERSSTDTDRPGDQSPPDTERPRDQSPPDTEQPGHQPPPAEQPGQPTRRETGRPNRDTGGQNGFAGSRGNDGPRDPQHGRAGDPQHGSPEASQRRTPRESQHGIPRESQHGIPRESQHGIPRESQHGIPRESQPKAGSEQAGTAPQPGGAEQYQPGEEQAKDSDHTRRQLLKAGIGLGAVAAVGAAFLRSQDGVEAIPEDDELSSLPDRSEMVFSWNGGELLGEPAFQEALDQELAGFDGGGPSSTAALADTIEQRTAIDPRETEQVTAFIGTVEGSGTYSGLIFESETASETVQDRLESEDVLIDTRTYRGEDFWIVGHDQLTWNLAICNLGDGEYALATQREIEDVIDARGNRGRELDERVVDGFEASADGLLTGGFVIPPSLFDDVDLIQATTIETNVEYGYARLAAEPHGELTVTIVSPDESAAEDVESIVNNLRQIDRENIEELFDSDSGLVEIIFALLEDLELNRDRREVSLVVEDGFRVLAAAIGYVVWDAIEN